MTDATLNKKMHLYLDGRLYDKEEVRMFAEIIKRGLDHYRPPFAWDAMVYIKSGVISPAGEILYMPA